MCGRFAQYRVAWDYLAPIGLDAPLRSEVTPHPINRYNVAPRSQVMTIRRDLDGLRFEPLLWGYAPFWAKGKRPPPINARLETVATSRFFRNVWQTGRCVVPADGWYEWVADPAEPKRKQPYYIHRRDGEPLYFACIGQFPRNDGQPGEEDGFVIITADSEGGMVDIHDRRPVVLSPESAAEWLNPDMEAGQAERVLLASEPVGLFSWHKVAKEVGNVRNEGPGLIAMIG